MRVTHIRKHTQIVSNPERDEHWDSFFSHVVEVALEVICEKDVLIMIDPCKCYSIVVLPCTMTSSLFWPQINHVSREICWVRNKASKEPGESHHNKFHIVIAEIVVDPKEEKFVLQP